MIKLIEKKSKYQDTKALEKKLQELEELTASQKGKGLGNPKMALDRFKEVIAMPKLATEFTQVHDPSKSLIKYSTFSGWDNQPSPDSNQDIEHPPTVVMVRLNDKVDSITCRINSETFTAPIPFIPPAVQGIAAKVKEDCPSVVFHVIFQPQWKLDPDADPILLAEVGGEFFKLAEWGGDKDILSEFVLNK